MDLPRFTCTRCGHTWVPRSDAVPGRCPNKKCNSPYWNKPRTRARSKATVERALIYATRSHRGQKDKRGLPYILHPIAVMLQMETDEERILALCHDIPEDTVRSAQDVAEDLGMSDAWATSLEVLTHPPNMPYEEYILRIKPYPMAVKVKLADMDHNMSRLEGLEDKERLMKKYTKGRELLTP